MPGAPWHAASLAGLLQDPADRGARGIEVPLRQPQQGQARLRLPAAVARLPIGLLGLTEIAERATDLPLAVTSLAGCGRVLSLDAALLGSSCLLQRLEPAPVQLHKLGAMGKAAARECDQVGLALAPAR